MVTILLVSFAMLLFPPPPPLPAIFIKAALKDLLKRASLWQSVMPSVVNVKAFVKMWQAVAQ